MSFPLQSPNGFPYWEKDPNAVKDYTLDWSAWLAGDTISTSTWTVPAELTLASDTKTGTTTTVWLSGGGAVGNFRKVTNRIVTVGGRTEDRSFELKIKEQ